MKLLRIAAPLALVVATGVIAACDTVAPAVPEPTPGPIAQSNALNGVYNLRASACGQVGSDTGLTIDGSTFTFPNATCKVASTESRVSSTRVTLSCDGSNTGGNRVVDLQVRDNLLRLTEDSTTISYYLCDRAPASSDAMVDL